MLFFNGAAPSDGFERGLYCLRQIANSSCRNLKADVTQTSDEDRLYFIKQTEDYFVLRRNKVIPSNIQTLDEFERVCVTALIELFYYLNSLKGVYKRADERRNICSTIEGLRLIHRIRSHKFECYCLLLPAMGYCRKYHERDVSWWFAGRNYRHSELAKKVENEWRNF